MPSLAVQISGGYVSVGGVPLAPLLVWAPQRRFGMSKVMESLMLLLARIRKVITGQR
jgi:hypothetical protein